MLMGSSSVPHLSRTVLLLIARGAISCAETVLWVITNQGLLLPLLFLCLSPYLCPVLTTTTTITPQPFFPPLSVSHHDPRRRGECVCQRLSRWGHDGVSCHHEAPR
jgi:hypothetical protein